MILKTKKYDERCLEIFEEDLINDETLLILTVYCIKREEGVWEFPIPQITNERMYEKYKDKYDEQILSFRNDCDSREGEKGSIVTNEIEKLKSEMEITQEAINEILFMGL